jgi:hypothetical protein
MAATKKPTGSRQNIFPKGPYESRNTVANAKRLQAPLASTLAARSPVGRINNLADPVFSANASATVGRISVPAAPSFQQPTTVQVLTPNAKQLLLTEIVSDQPGDDTPVGVLWLQFFLNQAPVSAFLPIGANLNVWNMVPTVINGTAGPAASTLAFARQNMFAGVSNILYNFDFDAINFINTGTSIPFNIAGLWASGSARIWPVAGGY